MRLILLVTALVVFAYMEARSAVICPSVCVGISHHIAIDSDTIRACSPSTAGTTVERIQFEVAYDDGKEFRVDADTECKITIALEPRNRVHTRARLCPPPPASCDGVEWSGYSPKAQKLEPICLGDMNYDGNIDSADFLAFRGAYITNKCAKPPPL